MNLGVILKLLLILFIGYLIFYVIKFMRIIRLNNRICKYTINNKSNGLSVCDYIFNVYVYLKRVVLNIISKSIFFQNVSKKYDKYSHNEVVGGLDIIGTKFTISILLGVLYIVYSLYSGSFNFMILLLVLFVSYFLYNVYLSVLVSVRTKHIENDLLRAVTIMNNSFKAGFNITQAVETVTKDLTGPISEEFSKISYDLKYGLELKDVFDRFYERVKLEDIKYITSSLALLNLTGGNLVGVFSNIEKSFTNNKRLRDELNSMTASSRLVYYVLLVMPVLLVTTLLLINPEYFKPLLSHPLGYIIILLILVMYVSYIFIIKRILQVEYE